MTNKNICYPDKDCINQRSRISKFLINPFVGWSAAILLVIGGTQFLDREKPDKYDSHIIFPNPKNHREFIYGGLNCNLVDTYPVPNNGVLALINRANKGRKLGKERIYQLAKVFNELRIHSKGELEQIAKEEGNLLIKSQDTKQLRAGVQYPTPQCKIIPQK
tara:strand:- start:5146 stop:5631 length:486 start_codon:yes stop_codon:yes gene_type:complete